jgi:hypothetical protein
LQAQLGAGWDLVSWDPRKLLSPFQVSPCNSYFLAAGGVLKSGPSITLFSSDAEYYDFWKQLQGKDKLGAHGNLTTPSDVAF